MGDLGLTMSLVHAVHTFMSGKLFTYWQMWQERLKTLCKVLGIASASTLAYLLIIAQTYASLLLAGAIRKPAGPMAPVATQI